MSLKASVLVPSYRRPDSLIPCLDAIIAGSRLPEQVVVVLRDTDRDSRTAFDDWLTRAQQAASDVQLVLVTEPGQAAATCAGLAEVRGDVVCFIDDDCRPTEQWLERLMAHYDDPSVVGAGGRDIVHHGDAISARPAGPVGRITWYGRMIGNHHQPVGEQPRDVDHLKGANMSFRRDAVVRFDTNVIGAHLSDTSASLAARAGGGRLVFDPLAAVIHYPAPRPHGYARQSASYEQVFADAHDWAYVMLSYLPPVGRLGFWLYALLIGQDRRFGLAKAIIAAPRGPRTAARTWWASLGGVIAGWATLRRARSRPSPTTGAHSP